MLVRRMSRRTQCAKRDSPEVASAGSANPLGPAESAASRRATPINVAGAGLLCAVGEPHANLAPVRVWFPLIACSLLACAGPKTDGSTHDAPSGARPRATQDPTPDASPSDAGHNVMVLEAGPGARLLDGGSAAGFSGAGHSADSGPPPADVPAPRARGLEPLPDLPRGAAQRTRFCNGDADDLVVDAFCAQEEPPSVGSLGELLELLNVDPARIDSNAGYALTANSTALSMRSVSAINPRILFVRLEASEQELLVVGYARGDTFVEATTRDRLTGELRFYLLLFSLPCEFESECTPGDLLTPAVEQNWLSLDPYSEEDLANTVLDCRHCHQPDGPGTEKILRMQELEGPWTHWFSDTTIGGQALLDDYAAAKGDEDFAGLNLEQIRLSEPELLALVVRRTSGQSQPNSFASGRIEAEVRDSAAAKGGDQPTDNSVPGQSETWQVIYESARRGEAIPVPYHDVKVTDPVKLAKMTEAYRAYTDGTLSVDALPDIRDVYPDDPERLAELGFATQPGTSAPEALFQACSQCHNDRLDQSISRADFNPALALTSTKAESEAIKRLQLPGDDIRAMPPRRLRSLAASVRDDLVDLFDR
jgi:hypothetical protein